MKRPLIRRLTVVDTFCLASFRGRRPTEEALPSPSTSARGAHLLGAIGHATLDRGRPGWLLLDNNQVAGLVTVQNKMTADVWDVDHLCWIASEGDEHFLSDLLSCAVSAAYAEGVQRVFLRVRADGVAEEAARHSGFVRYTTEESFLVPVDWPQDAIDCTRFRQRRRSDHQALFHLYSGAVPLRARQVEGMTLHEWRCTDGWRLYPRAPIPELMSRRRDFVIDLGTQISSWVQILPGGVIPSIVARSDAHDSNEELIHLIAALVGDSKSLRIQVRDYQTGLVSYLTERGYPSEKYALLSRSLAVRVAEPSLVPAQLRIP